MDTAHCLPQGIGVGVVKSMGAAEQGNSNSDQPRPILERRGRPQKDQALNCPRCNSTTTKFCYYNNYSLSQPRYFCKTCKRYWTEGGSLRNVPVGGGSRKNNKRSAYSSSSSPPSTSNASKKANNNILPHPQSSTDIINSQNPKIHHGQDLNLSYPPTSSDHQDYDNHPHHQSIFNPSSSAIGSSSPRNLSAIELLESTGINASRGLMNSFMVPDSINGNIVMFSGGHHHGFPTMQELKPSLGFSLHGFDGSGNYLPGVQETSPHLHHHHQARLLFPADQDSKPIPSTTAHTATTAADQSTGQFERNRGEGDHSGGFWNGILGGGSW